MDQAPQLFSEENVTPINPQKPLRRKPPPDVSQAVVLVDVYARILSARLLAIIALVGSLFMWAWVVYEPTYLGIWAAGLYSVLVLGPVLLLYANKRGGENAGT